MLPISKRRTLVIPHRLALIAAGMCLALAFTVDQAAVDETLQARLSEPMEQTEPASTGAVSVAQPEQSRDSPAGDGGSVSLLPWFSGLSR